MQNYQYTAGHAVAAYIWHRIKEEFAWSEDDYDGLIPMVPVQQQPELNSQSGPFIVFGSAFDPISPMWLINSETVAFTVFSRDESDINKVTQLVVDDLKRFDEAAAKINTFIDSLAPSHPAKDIDFKSVRISGASGPQPSIQEQGRKDGNIIVKAQYTRE